MHANEKLSVLSSITEGLQTNFGLLIGDSPPPHYFLVSHVGPCFPAQGIQMNTAAVPIFRISCLPNAPPADALYTRFTSSSTYKWYKYLLLGTSLCS